MTKQDYNINFERIKQLISKHEKVKNSLEIKKYNKESKKMNFNLSLSEALGWNFYSRTEKNYSMIDRNPLLLNDDEYSIGFV